MNYWSRYQIVRHTPWLCYQTAPTREYTTLDYISRRDESDLQFISSINAGTTLLSARRMQYTKTDSGAFLLLVATTREHTLSGERHPVSYISWTYAKNFNCVTQLSLTNANVMADSYSIRKRRIRHRIHQVFRIYTWCTCTSQIERLLCRPEHQLLLYKVSILSKLLVSFVIRSPGWK